MRKITLFLTLTIISLASLIATVVAAYYVLAGSASQYNNGGNIWSGMMSGMMGGYTGYGGTQTQSASSVAPYFGVAFVVLVGISVVGIGGLVYFLIFPEIRSGAVVTPYFPESDSAVVSGENTVGVSGSPYDSVTKTLTEDERKVVEVLRVHNGKYMQKYIRNETALSRLQTHRIVARLAERGIVTLEKTGNTNTVMLANWLT